MRHLLQDRMDVFGPDKRLGIFVVQPNILLDGGHQVRHAAEDASTDTLACDLSEPSLHRVQPRRTCRRKVKMEAGMLFQPSFDLGMFVRSVVVENHMDSQPLGGFSVDLPKEMPELYVAVSRKTGADDLAFQHVQRREQTGGSVALVVVGHRPAASFFHRQPRLRPIQRLHLRLLIHAQDHCLVRRVQVHPHHVRQLLDKALVLRELESFHAVRLQSVRVPNPGYCGVADSRGLGHCPRGPVSGSGFS